LRTPNPLTHDTPGKEQITLPSGLPHGSINPIMRYWALLITLVGFGIRLTLLGEQSLWYDEGVSWMLSQMQLPDLFEWTAADIQPPLYYLLIWGSDILISDSEWALRFPSALFNTLTIPVMFALAGLLFPHSRRLPLIATGITAASPLMVYYSQEARMYTLLTLTATLSGYLLVKLIVRHTPSARETTINPGYALLYILVTTAALYTHYFAAFLITAHALYGLFVLWRWRFSRPLLMQLALAIGGTTLLFAPWVPVLFARLGDDPSYWPGALKLDEAVRKVLISFTMGETVLEQTALWFTGAFLGLLLITAVWSLVTQSSSQKTLPSGTYPHIFLWLWLLVPLLLILLLSYQSPKFNPRYTLVAWPAFALILSLALDGLHRPHFPDIGRQLLQYSLLGLTYIFIVVSFTFSLSNWFTDPRFSKDDFQALAQFVRERRTADETVLLSSGHLFPVWAYYYGWEGWTALPYMPRLDVNRVTTLDVAAPMSKAITGYGGVWLVAWQDEVIDPNGVIPFWLDLIGERPIDAGDFWGVGLEHWRIDPEETDQLQETPIRHPHNLNFNDQLELTGMTQLNNDELVLFWKPLQQLPDTLHISLLLTDQDGFIWSKEKLTSRPGSYLYPPSRWPVGQLVITRHPLPWQTGTPPGIYQAEIELGTVDDAGIFSGWDILDSQGRPQRRTALVDTVNLSRLVQPDSGPLPPDPNPVADLSPIITLRRVVLPQTNAQPGDRVHLVLLWQAGEYNLDDVSVAFDLVDSQGQTFRVGSSFTPSRTFNLSRWKPGDMVLGQYWLTIPPAAASGPAEIRLHIVNTGVYDYDEVYPIGFLDILPTERTFTAPKTMDLTLDTNFSDKITLLGLNCSDNCQVSAGNIMTMTLFWRSDASTDISYTVFTHILDDAEKVLINADHLPPRQTSGWTPGEIISDQVRIEIPLNLSAGSYAVEIGLYDANNPDFARLPVAESQETRILLPRILKLD
jgi:mannosyltransferase